MYSAKAASTSPRFTRSVHANATPSPRRAPTLVAPHAATTAAAPPQAPARPQPDGDPSWIVESRVPPPGNAVSQSKLNAALTAVVGSQITDVDATADHGKSERALRKEFVGHAETGATALVQAVRADDDAIAALERRVAAFRTAFDADKVDAINEANNAQAVLLERLAVLEARIVGVDSNWQTTSTLLTSRVNAIEDEHNQANTRLSALESGSTTLNNHALAPAEALVKACKETLAAMDARLTATVTDGSVATPNGTVLRRKNDGDGAAIELAVHPNVLKFQKACADIARELEVERAAKQTATQALRDSLREGMGTIQKQFDDAVEWRRRVADAFITPLRGQYNELAQALAASTGNRNNQVTTADTVFHAQLEAVLATTTGKFEATDTALSKESAAAEKSLWALQEGLTVLNDKAVQAEADGHEAVTRMRAERMDAEEATSASIDALMSRLQVTLNSA